MMIWKKGFRALLALLLVGYSVCLLYWMFIGFGRTVHTGKLRYNIVPLHTIGAYLTGFRYYNLGTWIVNVLGNIGVFVPFGLCTPMLWRMKLGRFTVGFLVSIIVLELLQMLTGRGSFDIDDVILNTVGAGLGFGLQQLLRSSKGTRGFIHSTLGL